MIIPGCSCQEHPVFVAVRRDRLQYGRIRQCKTGNDLIRGRSDKIFCSDHCRTHWHNARNRDIYNHIRNVNNALRRNRRILYNCLAEKIKPSRSYLTLLGFDFSVFTGLSISLDDQPVYICYDIGFSIAPDHSVSIIELTAPAGSNCSQESAADRLLHHQPQQP